MIGFKYMMNAKEIIQMLERVQTGIASEVMDLKDGETEKALILKGKIEVLSQIFNRIKDN